MKKLKLAITIFALFLSSSIFASSITPSIIINGKLPERDDVFIIKYGIDSPLDLGTGYLNISENTNFIDKTETGDFFVYVGNYIEKDEIHNLKFSTVGFKKIGSGSDLNNSSFNFDAGIIPLSNKIYISFTNEDTSNLSMSLLAGSMYSIKDSTVSNLLTVHSATSHVVAGDPGYTFKFSWQSEAQAGAKVPAGDYVAQITVEYINLS
jgi:opacity protein-like surface antigen